MKTRPDVAPEALFQVYREADASLPESVVRRVEEVAAFHGDLITNRTARLSSEKERLSGDLDRVNERIERLGRERDTLLAFLASHRALDEFVAISNLLADTRLRSQKIQDYAALLDRYTDRQQELQVQMANANVAAGSYLKESKSVVEENLDQFRFFSQQFYESRPGGLTVKNNEGDNQMRFEIDARIQDDASDGINEVKIFCFDMAVLTLRHSHRVGFLFHDSRLFSDVDKRQRATMFRVAHDVTRAHGCQYIATINEDQIDGMRDQFSIEEFEECLVDPVVLRLTDESPEAKLLGIQVDMKY